MENADNTTEEKIDLTSITPDDLDRELLSRENPAPDDLRFLFPNKEGTPVLKEIMTATLKLHTDAYPTNEALNKADTMELIQALRLGKSSHFRHLWVNYEWMEEYQIHAKELKKNAHTVAAIVMQENLQQMTDTCFQLTTINYNSCINLSKEDPFYLQPLTNGLICTGFLVKEDIVATSAPWVNKENIKNLRILFGYQMQDAVNPVTTFSSENIYRGIKILQSSDDTHINSGWALIKLDRKVKKYSPARLSNTDVKKGQSLYTLGYPLGLPLKLISGPCALDDTNEDYFTANLGMYSSSGGTPVFDMSSDDIVGFVEHIVYPGFRWTGESWISIANGLTGTGYEGVKCTYPRLLTEALSSI